MMLNSGSFTSVSALGDAHQIALNTKLICEVQDYSWAPEIAVYLSKHEDNTSRKQISSKKRTFGRK